MASVGRQIRVFFRMKAGSRDVVKVFTNLRLPGLKDPRQLHICYLRKSTQLDAGTQMLVTQKLKTSWVRLFPTMQVEVDWPKALAMWERVGLPKTPRVDRTRALQRIMQWCTDDEQFARLHHQRIPHRLSHQVGGADDDTVMNWWLLEELPRLF